MMHWADHDEDETDAAPLLLRVDAAAAGQRLDRYVAQAVADLSRSFVRHLIDDGAVRLNAQAARPAQTVRPGDVITVEIPPPEPSELVPEALPLQGVSEDAAVVVVDKAAGMVVHPAPGHPRGTLANALLARYPDLQIGGSLRPGIVHRIDQDTSGLLVVARTDQAMHMLTTQQQAHTMHKAYLAVVEGRMKEPHGIIDAPIGRHPTDRKRQAIIAGGREARTHYRVLEELGRYTLLEARLETGRTHQIRVHFAAQQRPVLADPLYGPRRPRATFGLRRQFLHAYRLGFTLPSSGTWREFESPLPPELAAALEKLRRAAGPPDD
jgi:23S rRNA pseudouridine1911/1915/1917 synthase